eukprot:1069471-Amphidinium_carterae.1
MGLQCNMTQTLNDAKELAVQVLPHAAIVKTYVLVLRRRGRIPHRNALLNWIKIGCYTIPIDSSRYGQTFGQGGYSYDGFLGEIVFKRLVSSWEGIWIFCFCLRFGEGGQRLQLTISQMTALTKKWYGQCAIGKVDITAAFDGVQWQHAFMAYSS